MFAGSIISEPLQRLLLTAGEPVTKDFTKKFTTTHGPLTYEATGLPAASGLKVGTDGILTGTPAGVDALAPQPIILEITATDTTGAKVTQQQQIVISGNCLAIWGCCLVLLLFLQLSFRSLFLLNSISSNPINNPFT